MCFQDTVGVVLVVVDLAIQLMKWTPYVKHMMNAIY